MKKILLVLICTAVVVGLQLPKEKVALAGSLKIKQELLVQKLSEEEGSKEPVAEKPVDSSTAATKKNK